MEFPQVDLPVDLIACDRRYFEHIQTIMPSESMYLRFVH